MGEKENNNKIKGVVEFLAHMLNMFRVYSGWLQVLLNQGSSNIIRTYFFLHLFSSSFLCIGALLRFCVVSLTHFKEEVISFPNKSPKGFSSTLWLNSFPDYSWISHHLQCGWNSVICLLWAEKLLPTIFLYCCYVVSVTDICDVPDVRYFLLGRQVLRVENSCDFSWTW